MRENRGWKIEIGSWRLGIGFLKYYFCYLISIFYLLSSALIGCGYSTKGFWYTERYIFIPPITNNINIAAEERRQAQYTSFPALIEKRLTNSIVNKFTSDGHLKVVNVEDDALKLTCSITDYRKEALQYISSNDVKEQRLRLFVSMNLIDSKGQVLKEKEVVGETSFFLTGSRQKTETAAQDDLINDTSRRILEVVIEEW